MKDKKVSLLLLMLAIIILSLPIYIFWAVWWEDTGSVVRTQEIMMDVYIEDRIGLTADTDALHFGIVMPGGGARRKLTLDNHENYPASVTIESYGDIKEWVTVSENDFIINPLSSKRISVSLSVPVDEKLHSYKNGTLKLIFRRA
jgi:hypothetical protein